MACQRLSLMFALAMLAVGNEFAAAGERDGKPPSVTIWRTIPQEPAPPPVDIPEREGFVWMYPTDTTPGYWVPVRPSSPLPPLLSPRPLPKGVDLHWIGSGRGPA